MEEQICFERYEKRIQRLKQICMQCGRRASVKFKSDFLCDECLNPEMPPLKIEDFVTTRCMLGMDHLINKGPTGCKHVLLGRLIQRAMEREGIDSDLRGKWYWQRIASAKRANDKRMKNKQKKEKEHGMDNE
jgi:hypothetical protein